MLLNYDFLEFENDKKVRVIDDKLHVDILLKLMLLKFMQLRALSLIECMRKLEADYLLGLSQRLDLLKEFLQRIY